MKEILCAYQIDPEYHNIVPYQQYSFFKRRGSVYSSAKDAVGVRPSGERECLGNERVFIDRYIDR